MSDISMLVPVAKDECIRASFMMTMDTPVPKLEDVVTKSHRLFPRKVGSVISTSAQRELRIALANVIIHTQYPVISFSELMAGELTAFDLFLDSASPKAVEEVRGAYALLLKERLNAEISDWAASPVDDAGTR
jgi:hypothetical protein